MGLSCPAAAAYADTNTSINWSGYAVHHHRVKFRQVSGEWHVPTGDCTQNSVGYAAFWVGLGGYRLTSRALEQVGTEFDCTPSGQRLVSAWYEIVPSRVRRIHMRLNPGDLVSAKVRVKGHKVFVQLSDLTRHRTFHHTLKARPVDITSAEWIVEAPSECIDATHCRVLPLADFGSLQFTRATAETTNRWWGGVTDRHWNWSRIVLANTNGRRYVAGGSPSSVATPSGLMRGGRAFTINYAGTPTTTSGSGETVASAFVVPRAGVGSQTRLVSAP